MSKPIKVPDFTRRGFARQAFPDIPPDEADMVPTAIDLPHKRVLNAGVRKFLEMAKLYWPNKGGVVAFDTANNQQLAMALGLVYMAMREAEDAE